MRLGIWVLGILPSAALAVTPENLTVVYTGRTLGYARSCKEEVLELKNVLDVQQKAPSRARLNKQIQGVPVYERVCRTWDARQPDYGSLLKAQIEAVRGSGQRVLTLGVGDHFAVEYGARTMLLQRQGEAPVRVSKDELYYHGTLRGWVWRGDFRRRPGAFESVVEDGAYSASEIDGDSVATFLTSTRHDVLVPGRHDFHFGAESLRRLARLLKKGGTQMLGANLVMRATPLKPYATREEENRKRNYRTKDDNVTIELPKAVTPWLRQVNVSVKNGAMVEKLELCHARDVDKLATACQTEFLAAKGATFQRKPGDKGALPEGTHHLCAVVQGQTGQRYCEIVKVEKPFLDGNENGYYVSADRNAVVFGAVVRGMEKEVGRMSTVWKHSTASKERAVEIRVETIDPLTALRQQIDHCKARQECTPGRPRILLAQMPAETAASLQRSLGEDRFDLVIAEPSFTAFTPLQQVVFPAGYPPLVVSPKRPYDPQRPGEMSVHAQAVQLCGDCGAVSYGSQGTPWVAPMTYTPDLTCATQRALKTLGLHAGTSDVASFRDMVLGVMRREGQASVAILQKRDLFELERRLTYVPEGLLDERDRIRAGLERILWKGDFLFTRLVKGSVLKQLLARGKAFDTSDADIYAGGNRLNRGLWVLGAFEDKTTKSWIVDAAPIADEKVYAVAMPDYLAFGDTDYPELATPLVGVDRPVTDMKQGHRIADLVYKRMREGGAGETPDRHRPHDFHTYFDYLTWTPPASAPRATGVQLLGDYFKAGLTKRTPPLPGVSGGKPIQNNESLTQIRPRWRLLNEKSEFSVTWRANNQPNQGVLLSRFQGAQESRVETAKSAVWGAAWALELRREKRRSIDFLRTESSFSLQEQQNATGRMVRTYPQNDLSVEAGWRGSFTPIIHQKWWVGPLISGIWSTQLQSPRQAATYSFQKPGEGCPEGSPELVRDNTRCQTGFDAVPGRRSRYQVKAGLRGETRSSWAEIGLMSGLLRRPETYDFSLLAGTEPTARTLNKRCQLADALLAACLADLYVKGPQPAGFLQTTKMGNARETGIFANLNARIPLRADKRVEVVLENRGRFYFNHANNFPLDTRVYNVASAGLSVPLWGKLALKPTYTLLRFRNKADIVRKPDGTLTEQRSFGLTSYALEMKLEYRFDWLAGQNWGKILRYGGGTK